MSSSALVQPAALLNRLIPIFVLVLLTGFGASVSAQPGFGDNPPVKVSVESSATAAVPGTEVVFAIILDHEEHYHSNLNEPVVPAEMGDFAPVATTLTLPEIEGWSFGPIHWPSQQRSRSISFLLAHRSNTWSTPSKP